MLSNLCIRNLRKLLFILALCFCNEVWSTHITGGEITYSWLGNDAYEVTLKIYRDCGPDNTNFTGFDDPAHVGIYENDELLQTLDIFLFEATVTNVPAEISNPCLVTPPQVCIEECIYQSVVDLPASPTGYELVYVRCCRSPAIINLNNPQSQGMTLSTHIPGTQETTEPNSSAVFTNLPPTLICTGEPFIMDHSATDADGDSLSYEFCWPYLGADEFTPYPDPSFVYSPINVSWQSPYDTNNPIEGSPPFAVDPITGLFTGQPTMSGKWVYAICVTEYRNGVPINTVMRDYMVQILICEQVVMAAFTDPAPCQGLTINFNNQSDNANQYQWDFGVENMDADTSILAEPVYTYADSGVYFVRLIAQPGAPCADTLITQLFVYDTLQAAIQLDNFFCENGAMHYDFSLNGSYSDNANFDWSFPNGANPVSSTFENPPIITTSTSGNDYEVSTIIDDNSCELTITYSLDIPAIPDVEILSPPDPCEGLTVTFQSTNNDVTELLWDFGLASNNDTSEEEDPTFTFPEYGEHTITLTGSNNSGCSDSQTIIWNNYNPTPLIMDYRYYTPLPCTGDSTFEFEFLGSGETFIEWNGSNGDVGTNLTYSMLIQEEGASSVTLTIRDDNCGQELTETIPIFYLFDRPDLDIKMPNIITPDNDNKNNVFRPFDPRERLYATSYINVFDYIENYSLKIYDRWGVLLFENSGKNGWDGTFNGEIVSEGVYYYIVQYKETCSGKTVDRASHVTVVYN
jgi:gliding motility-associated-like protein